MAASGTFCGRSGRRVMAWLGAVACLAVAEPNLARTWRVEQDGSGEFTAIQPAVDAAAPGDTVMIGPGTYTEYSTVTLPGWSWPVDVYVYVKKDNLSIIGADSELVIIGPASQDFLDFGPKGVVAVQGVNQVFLANITLRNSYDGVHRHTGFVEMKNIAFMHCENGYYGSTSGNMLITSCSFIESTNDGIFVHDSDGSVNIMACDFSDCDKGISIQNCANVTISRCSIDGDGSLDGCAVGVQLATSSEGNIVNCTITDVYSYGVAIIDNSSAYLAGNRITNPLVSVAVKGGSEASGGGNMLIGAEYAALYVTSSTLNFENCHIMNGGGRSVLLNHYYGPEIDHIQLGGNYWGTSDSGQIAEWIWDGHDDPTIKANVDYEPFSPVPVGTEQKSWGGVKEMYRSPGPNRR